MRMAVTSAEEQTFEGKLLPRHLKMFRDMDSGRIELRYWKFEPILLFLIPFMSVWSGGAIFGCYVMPFLQQDTHPMNYLPFLFGIPFLVASIFIWYGILLMLFGTRRLVLEHGCGSYSAKLWGIGRTRRFDLRIDTEITDSRLEKKPNIQIHMPTANNPFVRKIRIKNGYRSEIVCAFWDEDSIEFALSLLKRRAGISTRN